MEYPLILIKNDKRSRIKRIALLALDAACQSEILYAVAADYTSQIDLLVPALLDNCITVSVEELVG